MLSIAPQAQKLPFTNLLNKYNLPLYYAVSSTVCESFPLYSCPTSLPRTDSDNNILKYIIVQRNMPLCASLLNWKCTTNTRSVTECYRLSKVNGNINIHPSIRYKTNKQKKYIFTSKYTFTLVFCLLLTAMLI